MREKPIPRERSQGDVVMVTGPQTRYVGELGRIEDFYYYEGAKSKGYYDYGVVVELLGNPTETFSGKRLKLSPGSIEEPTEDVEYIGRQREHRSKVRGRSKAFARYAGDADAAATHLEEVDPVWAKIARGARVDADDTSSDFSDYNLLKHMVNEEFSQESPLFREKVFSEFLNRRRQRY